MDYKWVALSNTTLGVLLATIDGSIVLIAMPSIFRGIHLDPLRPGNSFYLLWMILGFLVVSSVLVVSLGRLGDQYGRVRMYNFGFVVYTLASLLLTIDWLQGRAGADWLIAVFDRWYNGSPQTRIRLFEDIVSLVLGGPSRGEQVGISPSGLRLLLNNKKLGYYQSGKRKLIGEGHLEEYLSLAERKASRAIH